jgi:organic radical activating enzyme
MSKIKVSELFYSLQGEGRYQGVPSIFLRTFGCNFTCGGFGMPKGQKSEERLAVDPTKYTDYKQLPLVKTGCDSYASWDPRFKHLSPFMTDEEISARCTELMGMNRWGPVHLVITGGEPLLPGWQKQYPELLDRLVDDGLTHLTFETNGTQRLTEELDDWFSNYASCLEVTFSVSPKLTASGEDIKEAINLDAVDDYYMVACAGRTNHASQLYFKFVVETEEHVYEVNEVMREYSRMLGPHCPVYLMPVGGTGDLYYVNNVKVAELAMKYGYRYSPRLQVDLWKNAWGT